MHTTDLYFESHITIDPIFGEEAHEVLAGVVHPFGFKVAELYMQKGVEVPGRPATRDTFMTARGTDYEALKNNTLWCVECLQSLKVRVRRYKLENTLLDVRLPVRGASCE